MDYNDTLAMTGKVAFDEPNDVFHPPFAFRILLAAHAHLKSALPDVGSEFGCQDQVTMILADEQQMILIIDDLTGHAAEKFEGIS